MLTRDLKNEYQGNTKNRTPSHVIKTNEFFPTSPIRRSLIIFKLQLLFQKDLKVKAICESNSI